jgi:hypothetical protein
MSSKLNTAIAVAGIDIGKNSFHVIGLDKRGAIVLLAFGEYARLPDHALAPRKRWYARALAAGAETWGPRLMAAAIVGAFILGWQIRFPSGMTHPARSPLENARHRRKLKAVC